MKRTFALLFLFLVFLAFSCQPEGKYGEPVLHPQAITKNLMNFLVYRQKYLRLTEDFTAIDSAENVLDRETFLKQLSTGRYFPLRLRTKDSMAYYRLYSIPDTAADIRLTVSQWGEHLYSLYRMEGKALPVFSFSGVDGRIYNKENTAGKILVLKCWFLHCVPCVKEIPALNRLVKEYNNRKDVVFVSLVPDKKEAVDSFLKKTPFTYAVVPDKREYERDSLGITVFPTHILINKQGRIVKVMNEEKELAVALKNEAAKQPAL